MTYKNSVKSLGGELFKLLLTLRFFGGLQVVLMYHRVVKHMPQRLYDPSLIVTSKTFELHIKELLRYFDIVPLEAIIRPKAKSGRFCAITFDDGWVDNYECAFPILKHYNVPATIFIPVNLIGDHKGLFWYELLVFLAEEARKSGKEERFNGFFSSVVPSFSKQKLDSEHLCELTAKLKTINAAELDQILRHAYDYLGVDLPTNRSLLSWDEIQDMSQHGITFGSHGLNHFILTTLDHEAKKNEITNSYQFLREKTVTHVPFFCYPNGNWDIDSLRLLAGAGYHGAVTTSLGVFTDGSNRYLMHRVALHEYISSTRPLFWFRIMQGAYATESA